MPGGTGRLAFLSWRNTMKSVISAHAKKIARTFSLLYFSSYVMRINFAVMLVKVITETASTKSALSIVLTALTVTYGIGQIVSGILGDKLNPAHLLSVGLGVATVANAAMFFTTSIPAMAVIWGINGMAHALLWPPIVRLMSLHLTDEEYGYAAVRVSWGSSVATILLYLGCPLLLHVMSWRTVMLLCALLGAAVTVFWLLIHPTLLPAKKKTAPVQAPSKAQECVAAGLPLPRYVYLPIVLIMLAIILQGMLRDGVTNWMPSYLLETFSLPEEDAIISTVILAVFSMISFTVFDLLHRKLFQNEVFCAAAIFVLSAVAALILYPLNLFFPSPLPSMLLMAIIVGSMHGINLMLITVLPKRFVKSGKVSTYSGLLNACTYVGAAISSYGFAALAESFGWSATILTWIIISAVGAAVCFATAPIWKKFRREYAD